MPFLGGPAVVGAVSGSGGTVALSSGAAATGGTLLGGVTVAQAVTAGVVIASAVTTGVIIEDYLDRPADQAEIDTILAQAGDRSKTARERLKDCRYCIWCQINIQAQGTLIYGTKRPTVQGIGPYLVQDRTVFTREGIMVLGLTHQFVEGLAGSRNFAQIEGFGTLAATAALIQRAPASGGFPPGEYRAPARFSQNTLVRYDVMIPPGSINAFMS